LLLARSRLPEAIADLAHDPRPPGVRKLVAEHNAWRMRVGDYHVVYEVVDRVLTVTVLRAGHRREVYNR
jgi:mRNA interferase RelE/StbE